MAKYENKYMVVYGSEDSIQRQVSDLMAHGWKTVGGVFVRLNTINNKEIYYQAMRLNVLNTPITQ